MKENEETKVETAEKTFSKEVNIETSSNREPKRYKEKSKTESITLDNEEVSDVVVVAPQEAAKSSTVKTTNKSTSDNDADNNNSASNSTGLGVGMSIQERLVSVNKANWRSIFI